MSLDLLWRQITFTPEPVPVTSNLAGKTALVTGGTSGLGLECSRGLLQRKLSHLIITARTKSRAEITRQELLEDSIVSTQNPDCTISTYELDLSNYESTMAFSEHLKRDGIQTLDITVLNAGVRHWEKVVSPTGHEDTMQVNYLSNALLVLLLNPIMRATTGPAKLILITSELHGPPLTTFKERHQPELVKYMSDKARVSDLDEQYYISKLFIIFLVRELASGQRVDPNRLVVCCVDPGFVGTNIGHELKGFAKFMTGIMIKLFAYKPVVGARTVLRRAVTGGTEMHGKYYGASKPDPWSMIESDEGKQLQTRVWEQTLALLMEDTSFDAAAASRRL